MNNSVDDPVGPNCLLYGFVVDIVSDRSHSRLGPRIPRSSLNGRLLVLPVQTNPSFTLLTNLSGAPSPSQSRSPALFLYCTHSTPPVFVNIFHRDRSNCLIIHYVYIYKNLFYKDSIFQIISISYIIIRHCYSRFYILLQKFRKCTAKTTSYFICE